MYRRPKFLEVLIRIREEMAREADYDTDLFSEMVRSGMSKEKQTHSLVEPSSNGAAASTRKKGSEPSSNGLAKP